MKIRLSLTFEVLRDASPDPDTTHEHRDLDSVVQLADPHPVGFVPPHEQRPDERAR